MIRRVVDLGTCVAVIEPSDSNEPFVTLLRDDDGYAKSFYLDCPLDELEKFIFACQAAIEESRQEAIKGVDTDSQIG